MGGEPGCLSSIPGAELGVINYFISRKPGASTMQREDDNNSSNDKVVLRDI